MRYCRATPSPRYVALVAQYRDMHLHGDPHQSTPAAKVYPGSSLLRQAPHIKALVERTCAETILDYGSGKALAYTAAIRDADGTVWENIVDLWGVTSVYCYDPAFPPFSKLPEGTFDGVICTDVLEHCPEEDVEWVIDELFGFATRFVFADVACFLAQRTLPNGENAHCTVRGKPWWEERFRGAASRRPGVLWELYAVEMFEGPRYVPMRCANFDY
jgi:hypothetical protein